MILWFYKKQSCDEVLYDRRTGRHAFLTEYLQTTWYFYEGKVSYEESAVMYFNLNKIKLVVFSPIFDNILLTWDLHVA